ncbi:MAG: hypothetical protein IJV27_12210, partial [Prevotella sp.]|nr:hypothetical protein [Prevotella sp.]
YDILLCNIYIITLRMCGKRSENSAWTDWKFRMGGLETGGRQVEKGCDCWPDGLISVSLQLCWSGIGRTAGGPSTTGKWRTDISVPTKGCLDGGKWAGDWRRSRLELVVKRTGTDGGTAEDWRA